ncbi:MAG: toxin Bro [Ruminococcaceae bacterium]|nr:toxin Bro [Oscillospiraceae bacterium]
MNKLQVFNNPNFGQVRTIDENGKVLFCGSDVAKALGYDQPHKAIERHCRYGMKCTVPHPQSADKTIEMTFIPEGDIYRLIAHSKLPAAEQFESWVFDEVLPTIRKTGEYSTRPKSNKDLEIRESNARVRLSNQFLKLAKVDTLSTEYKNILVSKAAEALTGFTIVPLPVSQQRMYTATEIGKMFGVSAQRIGKLSNEYGLKTSQYGEWYRDKAQHSSKEIDSFRYNDTAVERFKTILNT